MSQHLELTSEVRQITDLLADTKYNDPKEHPVLHATIKRLKAAVHEHGSKEILPVAAKRVSEELRETLYDNQMRPHMDELEELSRRYCMPFFAVVEWGDNFECAVVRRFGEDVPSPRIQMAVIAESCDGDVDLFIQKMGAIASTTGHNSTVLEKMGVPKEPGDDIKDSLKGI